MTVLAFSALSAAAAPTERPARERDDRRPARVIAPAPGTISQPARPRPALVGDSARFLVESSAVSFGEVIPGLPALVPTAMLVRVFSERPWTLTLVPTSMLTVSDRADLVSLSRLEWRSSRGGAFTQFRENAPVTIASGQATGGGGHLVVVDLRLQLLDDDPLGSYGCSFRVELDRVP